VARPGLAATAPPPSPLLSLQARTARRRGLLRSGPVAI